MCIVCVYTTKIYTKPKGEHICLCPRTEQKFQKQYNKQTNINLNKIWSQRSTRPCRNLQTQGHIGQKVLFGLPPCINVKVHKVSNFPTFQTRCVVAHFKLFKFEYSGWSCYMKIIKTKSKCNLAATARHKKENIKKMSLGFGFARLPFEWDLQLVTP